MASHLPEDIVINILSRLPPFCLVRFRVVCKSWCTLLSDPKFMYKNILHSRDDEKGSSCFLVLSRNEVTRRHAFSVLANDTLEISMTHGLPHSDTRGGLSEEITNIVGSCNGLVCIHTRFSHIVLWNPATKESKVLPQSHVLRSPDQVKYLHQLGFGFDPRTKDYKVVRIVDLYRDGEEELIIDKLVEVYSLRNDSWRKLEVVLPADLLQSPGWHTASCDTYHWRGYYDQSEKESIVSFDMSSETFKMKLLPDFNRPGDVRWNNFKRYFMLNELLAMVNTRHELKGRTEHFAEIWIQLKDGVDQSWNKLFTIGPLKAVRWALGFRRTGEVFFGTCSGQILQYEPITHEISTLPVIGQMDTLQIASYRESQVSLVDGNDPESDDNNS